MLLNGQGSLLSRFIVKFHEIFDSSSQDAKAKGNSTSQRSPHFTGLFCVRSSCSLELR